VLGEPAGVVAAVDRLAGGGTVDAARLDLLFGPVDAEGEGRPLVDGEVVLPAGGVSHRAEIGAVRRVALVVVVVVVDGAAEADAGVPRGAEGRFQGEPAVLHPGAVVGLVEGGGDGGVRLRLGG